MLTQKLYSSEKEKLGDSFPHGHNYIYGAKTSNSSLRPHLERVHYELYCKKRNKYKWKTLLPGEVLQATSSGIPAQDTQVDEYDDQTFVKYLLEFVVADDQVCFLYLTLLILYFLVSQSLNVIECPEFRALLKLLCPNVSVPRQSKMRELILQAWRCYFQDLKSDLAVSSH
jgi:hypothetical protein